MSQNFKKLLVIQRGQIGSPYDYYPHLSNYLKCQFDLHWICLHQGFQEIKDNLIKIKYVFNDPDDTFYFKKEVFAQLKKEKYDFIFLIYFPGCSILKLLNKKQQWILDIRSANTSSNKVVRYIKNMLLKLEIKCFNNITIISDSLANKLKLKEYQVLPLGAIDYVNKPKSFDEIVILYVGIIRDSFEKTVEGFNLFLKKKKDKRPVKYVIIGKGKYRNEAKLKKMIMDLHLEDTVEFKGRVESLYKFFDTSNVGLSYIPMKDYFDCQPPTKTLEYILSGMPCLATATFENKRLVNEKNGVICLDTPEGIANGLEELFLKLDSYSSDEIKRSLEQYKIENIVSDVFIPYLKSVDGKKL